MTTTNESPAPNPSPGMNRTLLPVYFAIVVAVVTGVLYGGYWLLQTYGLPALQEAWEESKEAKKIQVIETEPDEAQSFPDKLPGLGQESYKDDNDMIDQDEFADALLGTQTQTTTHTQTSHNQCGLTITIPDRASYPTAAFWDVVDGFNTEALTSFFDDTGIGYYYTYTTDLRYMHSKADINGERIGILFECIDNLNGYSLDVVTRAVDATYTNLKPTEELLPFASLKAYGLHDPDKQYETERDLDGYLLIAPSEYSSDAYIVYITIDRPGDALPAEERDDINAQIDDILKNCLPSDF
ncbi:MAG TPA: hypothetical protein PKL83_04130 [bacterium]|nr:hypothetical protein [bacterium]